MRRIGWLALTLLLLALTLLVKGWPELRQWREMNAPPQTAGSGTEGDLPGVHVSVEAVRMLVLPQAEDRAVIYLRLALRGDAATFDGWIGCNLALRDSRDRMWLPLFDKTAGQVAKILGDGDDPDTGCSRSLWAAGDPRSPRVSVQAFLVPAAVTQELRLSLSSMVAGAPVLSLPIKPVLRPAY